MSMNAEFVQIDETELVRLQREPAWAETLFQNAPVIPPSLAALSEVLQNRMRSSGTRLMADVLSQMNPETRKQMEARLGVTTAALSSGEGGDLLIKAMEERRSRLAAMMPGRFPAGSGGSGPAAGNSITTPSAPRKTLSLAKAWHGVHYVICGAAEPGPALLSQAILGGVDIGDDDEGFSGYGPARYFTAAQVAELARLLVRPELETEAAARFDSTRMAELELYPGWDVARAEDDREWIMNSFRRLRDFFADAAAERRAIVTCLI